MLALATEVGAVTDHSSVPRLTSEAHFTRPRGEHATAVNFAGVSDPCCFLCVPTRVATTLVPGSHKSLFLHPRVHSSETGEGNMRINGATLEGAIEVHLKAGDAVRPRLLLVHDDDCCTISSSGLGFV